MAILFGNKYLKCDALGLIWREGCRLWNVNDLGLQFQPDRVLTMQPWVSDNPEPQSLSVSSGGGETAVGCWVGGSKTEQRGSAQTPVGPWEAPSFPLKDVSVCVCMWILRWVCVSVCLVWANSWKLGLPSENAGCLVKL